ncbi:MAG: hypothetical protein KGL35_30090, partial [Bradyrhizobium sp.]|nr:hypothetical protein [Bradyrhizobium sp.]
MALVEIDESELRSHRAVTEAMQKLLSNPKTRGQLLRLQKEVNPDVVIPEVDAVEPFQAEVGEVKNALAEMKKMLADEQAAREAEKKQAELRASWDRGRTKLRNSGYTDEGLTAVEAFMEEQGIANHEVAAAAYERLHPPQTPVRAAATPGFDIFDSRNRNDDAL